jgi:hypothetical protein
MPCRSVLVVIRKRNPLPPSFQNSESLRHFRQKVGRPDPNLGAAESAGNQAETAAVM